LSGTILFEGKRRGLEETFPGLVQVHYSLNIRSSLILIHVAANVAETTRIPIAIKSELGLLSGQNVPRRVQ
jgi:hypothetical protein